MSVKSKSAKAPFTFDEFQTWYEDFTEAALEPARLALVRLLRIHVQQGVSELDRHRIRVGASRVKSTLRTWSKLQKPKYIDQISSLSDVPKTIDDLIGIRITCNNLSDVDAVRTMMADLPHSNDSEIAGLSTEHLSERPYFANPKESGYRAFHVNLVTRVAGLTEYLPVRAELQVRTILQDGWGELTHEDTYKPGIELPPLVTTLARRMADLLATVDELAQDLRLELDRLAQSAVEDEFTSEQELPSTRTPSSSGRRDSERSEFNRSLVISETARTVAELRQPTSLASIAAVLQGAFGTSIRDDWAGFRTFKALLLHAAPNVNIVNAGPGYVVPPGLIANSGWPKPLLNALPSLTAPPQSHSPESKI